MKKDFEENLKENLKKLLQSPKELARKSEELTAQTKSYCADSASPAIKHRLQNSVEPEVSWLLALLPVPALKILCHNFDVRSTIPSKMAVQQGRPS
jgi:hypothetical protein